jgi:hypothetical protein
MTTTRLLRVTRENLYDFVDGLSAVFNVSWFDSIKGMEAYLLFSEEYVAHEGPLGIVNINDLQKVLIFDDLYEKYGK